MQHKLSLIAVVLLAWGLAALLAILPVRAAAPRVEAGNPAYSPSSPGFTVTFWVNTSQDFPDYDPSDNLCTTDAFGFPCSLRAAVNQANTLDWPYGDPQAVVIIVPAGRYTLTIPPNGSYDPNAGDLDVYVTRTLAIYGAGVGNTIIRGPVGWNDRLLAIDGMAHVVISGVTLQNANPGSGNGGLIWNGGSLQLTNVMLKNSGANMGGGIFNAGNLSLDGSTVFNNGAVAGGGGIYDEGLLTVTNSTIDSNYGGGIVIANTVPGPKPRGFFMSGSTISGNYGAGIGISGTAVISGSTIVRNIGNSNGGGIYNAGWLTLTNSLVMSNTAISPITSNGGGIYHSGAMLRLENVTLGGNRTARVGGGIANLGSTMVMDSRISGNVSLTGGGIFNTSTLTVSNSLVLSNTADMGGGVENDGVMDINGSTIMKNVANNYGGGIRNTGRLILGDSVLVTNTAYTGGGIFDDGSMAINDSLVVTNSAENGGGIFLSALGTLDLNRSTLRGNVATGASDTLIGQGGGISAYGLLTITGSAIDDNWALTYGGGIFYASQSAMLWLNRSAVNGNRAGSSGGGITNSGAGVLDGSMVSANTAPYGGGIYNGVGTLSVVASTISANRATSGAGIESFGALTLTNSTVSSNLAKQDGGGLYVSSTVSLNNATISNNTADSDADGNGNGGGVFVLGGTFKLRNTLIAGNRDNSPAARHPDCFGALVSQGYNLVGALDASACVFTPLFDQVGTLASPIDPKLGPVQNNGGPTPTHALLPGSPAIDAAAPLGCSDANGNLLATDQRGVTRPQGARCDVGAFEAVLLRVLLPLIVR